jgi:predicted CXXCH cytochrome family protein
MSEPFPETDPQGDFWPDGRPSRFNRPQALTLSGCFIAGRATCTSCHEAHASPNQHALKVPLAESDGLCTQCHTSLEEPAALTRHSRHPAGSPGSDCVQCHMSEVNWRLLNRRRDHTFAPPVPELTAEFGIPNACTTCHDNRTPEWAVEVMDTWYGDGARRLRAVAMTRTFYAASAGDRGVLDQLGDLTIDRTHGALIRASAADYIGRLASPTHAISPGTLQALIRASLDPEPMVRVAAVRALGTNGGDTAIPTLADRLADTARVVRVSAAESLLYLGVTTGLGAALTAAQNEYADSLREFPDVASNHAALGWLLAARGRTDEAVLELRLAQSLDPRDARPLVYLGVLAARDGRFGEAIEAWRAARRLKPDYPNIDRLIAEAERRQ